MLSKFFLLLLIFSFVTGQMVRLDFFGIFFPLLDASLLLFILHKMLTGKFSFKKYFKNKYLLLFILSLLTTNIINFPSYSLGDNLRGNLYLVRFILYSLVLGVDFKSIAETRKAYAKIISIIGFIIAVIGIFQFIFLPDLRFLQYQNWDDHLNRLTFPYLDPSFTAAILLIFLIYLLDSQRFKPFAAMTKIILSSELIAIFLTFSRATWIITAIILTVFLFTSSGVWVKKFLWGLGGIGVIGILVSIILFKNPFLSYGNKIWRVETIASRQSGVNKAVQIWQKNPIFGVGFNNYKIYQIKNKYDVKNGIENRGEASVENSFMFVLATSGLIGFICFTLWIWDMIRRLGQTGKYVLISILIGSFFNNLFFYPFILLVIFFQSKVICET